MLLYLQDMGGAALMLALSHVIISAQLPVRLYFGGKQHNVN
jgi:leucyl aminopeptidase